MNLDRELSLICAALHGCIERVALSLDTAADKLDRQMPPWDDADDFEDEIESTDDFDEEPTIACPYCSKEIHEDAQWCPYCENYLSADDAPPPRRPWWLVAGVLVCLAIVLTWVFFF